LSAAGGASVFICGAGPLGALPLAAGVSFETSVNNVPNDEAAGVWPAAAAFPSMEGAAAGAAGTTGAGNAA
jgi:hypothetical protein